MYFKRACKYPDARQLIRLLAKCVADGWRLYQSQFKQMYLDQVPTTPHISNTTDTTAPAAIAPAPAAAPFATPASANAEFAVFCALSASVFAVSALFCAELALLIASFIWV